MYPSIKNFCDQLVTQFDEISLERKELLEKVSAFITQKKAAGLDIKLVYICTHNSRRSHFGQVWANVAADYFHVENVSTFSGGTEATAFNPNAINALHRVGFDISTIEERSNPVYRVAHSDAYAPSICFSKVYDDVANPQAGYAAIMTCSDAEENCPFIPGVELRIGTTYDDPKAFDNTPLQDAKYNERCRQIALETFYVFSKIS
jgi:protein-tyrosine phosphatase/arsenate reductase